MLRYKGSNSPSLNKRTVWPLQHLTNVVISHHFPAAKNCREPAAWSFQRLTPFGRLLASPPSAAPGPLPGSGAGPGSDHNHNPPHAHSHHPNHSPHSQQRVATHPPPASAASSVPGLAGSAPSAGAVIAGGTVFRTVDPVVAAASAARAACYPAATGAAAAFATHGTFSSVESMDVDNRTAGVRLLVVVGVVLLDDPEWIHQPADAAVPAAAAAVVDGSISGDQPVRVLLAQRPEGKSNAGLWEFPGGKVDPGETPEAALVRELREELGISVDPTDLQPLTFASHTYPTFHLLMPLYVCRRWSGEPHGVEGQAVVWATAEEVTSYNLTPADIPLVPAVLAAMRYKAPRGPQGPPV